MTLLAALTGALAISFSAIFFALSDATPVTGAVFRFGYALPVLFLIWWARRGQDRRTARRRWLAFGAGALLGLDVMIWHLAIDYIGAGLATLIANSQVIFVTITAWVLLGERPSRQSLTAVPVVLAGVALVTGLGRADSFGANPVLGTVYALLAALFYSAFILGLRHSNDIRAPVAGGLLEATAGALLSSLLVGGLTSGIALVPTWPGHGWLLALALGVQVGGWLLIGYALPRLPAVETATIILLQPVLTIGWGTLIFAERPSAVQLVGAALVLSGVGWVAVSRARGTGEPVTAAG